MNIHIEGYKQIEAVSEQSTQQNALKSAFNKVIASLAAIDKSPLAVQVAVQEKDRLWHAKAIAYYV